MIIHYCQEKFLIETDLTPEELAIIEKSMKDYREHPETFVPSKLTPHIELGFEQHLEAVLTL
ncbi:hypothetical protein AGMMS49587_15580 [Spirochaetia bacterium]|nr:hypothetical protein AGMMS49587_15580 [Spirochaetia bacterium]